MVAFSTDQAFHLAYECYRAGRTAKAIELCRAVLKVEPGHPYGAFLLALIAARDGRRDEADQWLAHAVERRAHSITLDFPPPDAPRHAEHPNPALHAVLEGNTAAYRALLESFARFLPRLSAVPATARNQEDPHWSNPWIPAFDGIALYCLTALARPRRYVEVGSGISTRFVRRAIRDHGLSTVIVSIDPEPRAEIDSLCDELIRTPLERADLGLFEELAAGDIVFVDSSHRCFMGSDVTVLFTEVLPSLEAGVTVGLHDIFLPFDYPAEWVPRYYSEQYLLACYLLAGGMPFRVVLPMHFALRHPACADAVRTLAAELPAGVAPDGGSFWLEMMAAR
jgi:hypothetical protein